MFGRGIKVFTLFGIPVYLDVSFFVIVPLFAWLLANNLHSYAKIVGLGEETSQVFGIDTSAAPEPADGARVVTPRRIGIPEGTDHEPRNLHPENQSIGSPPLQDRQLEASALSVLPERRAPNS